MKKQTDTFKRLRSVIKDVNGDKRQMVVFCKQDIGAFPILLWKYAVILPRQALWQSIRQGNCQRLLFAAGSLS